MSEGSKPHAPHEDADHDDAEAERFLVRNPLQIRQLLRQLAEQRSLISAHVEGRDLQFPTAVLELDEDEDSLVLDGSPQEASNQAAEQAGHLLCIALLERVMVRFQVDGVRRTTHGPHAALHARLPVEVLHLQRREMYRLETPVTDSPLLLLPAGNPADDSALSLRVVDISGGGLAVNVPLDSPLFALQRHYQAELSLPDGPQLQVGLRACNVRGHTLPNGTEVKRVGLQFEQMPRGADNAIQRYIFRIDRQRSARRNGEI